MVCDKCGCKMKENLDLLASPGGKLFATEQISKHRYSKERFFLVVNICPECGYTQLNAKNFCK